MKTQAESGGLLRGAAKRRFNLRVAANNANMAIDKLLQRIREADGVDDTASIYVPSAEAVGLRTQLQDMIVDLRRIQSREDAERLGSRP